MIWSDGGHLILLLLFLFFFSFARFAWFAGFSYLSFLFYLTRASVEWFVWLGYTSRCNSDTWILNSLYVYVGWTHGTVCWPVIFLNFHFRRTMWSSVVLVRCHCLFACWFMKGDTSPCSYVIQRWKAIYVRVTTSCDSHSSHSQQVTVTAAVTVTLQILMLEFILHFGFLCLTDLAKVKERNRRHCNCTSDTCRMLQLCHLSWFTIYIITALRISPTISSLTRGIRKRGNEAKQAQYQLYHRVIVVNSKIDTNKKPQQKFAKQKKKKKAGS